MKRASHSHGHGHDKPEKARDKSAEDRFSELRMRSDDRAPSAFKGKPADGTNDATVIWLLVCNKVAASLLQQ